MNVYPRLIVCRLGGAVGDKSSKDQVMQIVFLFKNHLEQ